jgi:hypothetical protein
MGMETGLLTLLVLLAVSNAFEYVESGRRERLFVVAVSLGGAVLTRTDAVLFAGLVWAFVACELAAGGAARRRLTHLFVPLLVFAAFVVSQLAFQYWYYEALLPNTYTLKLTGMSLASRIENGLGFVAPFLRETVLILAACLAATIFTRRPRAVLLLAMMLVAIGYQVYVGGDPWNYWRIMAPTMPLAFVLVVVAIGRGVAIGSGRDADADSTMSAVAVAATMAILLSASVRFLPEVSLLRKPYLVEKSRENMNIALLLKRLTARDATVGVLFAGTIPYYLDRRAIDFLGKSDRHLATLSPDLSGRVSWSGMMSVPGHNKYDLHYSIGQLKPTYVQTLEWGSHDVTQWARDHYVLVEQQGVKLWLLKDSTAVDWNRVARRGE